MIFRSSRRIAFFLATLLQLNLFAIRDSAKAASSLAAWKLGNDGVLKLRTSAGAKLQAYFAYADAKKGDRVWIDFPGELIRPRTIQGNGPVDEIRLGKPHNGFTRLVIEFKNSISIDPKKLVLKGTAPDRWELNIVGLPDNNFSNIGEGDLIRRSTPSTYLKPNYTSNNSSNSSNLPEVIRDKYSIVIDPGHGGRDVGAVGIGGIHESDVVLDISLQVAKILKSKGLKVIMTRSAEIDLDLYPRVSLANRSDVDLFVSIHANASRNKRKDVNGIETFFYSGAKGYKLASYIQDQVVRVSPGSPDRGVRKSRFYVIRWTHMPAALVETGFLTGRMDSSRLAQASHRNRLAIAISRGILLYLKEEEGR